MEKQPPFIAEDSRFAELPLADAAAKKPATFKSLFDQFYSGMLLDAYNDTTFETQAARPFFMPAKKGE